MIEIVQKRIKELIDQKKLQDKQLIVAVSGGSDSLCLLHALHALNLNILVAHLNHMIRGSEAEQDALFVENFCKDYEIPYIIEHIDVIHYQKENKISSLEEAARCVRYDFLYDIASKNNGYVVTGHNQNDNVETIMMHIIRGCGPAGLVGLPMLSGVKTSKGTLNVFRPLLNTSKQETIAYCQEIGLEPRHDSTNESAEYTRNKIRKVIMPLLSSINPDVNSSILRLSTLTNELIDFADSKLDNLPYMLDILDDTVIITRREFNNLESYAKKTLIRLAIKALLGNIQDIENKHIDEMIALASGSSGKKISLPNGLIWSVEYMKLTLSFNTQNIANNSFDIELKIPGDTICPNGIIHAELIDKTKCIIENNPLCAYFDYNLLDDLYIRNRIEGDSFIPFGTNKSKKVARFLLDAHCSQTERAEKFVMCNNDSIIWIVGVRQSNLYKITEETTIILKISFIPD